MKILFLGLDSNIFDPKSPVADRFRLYGKIADKIDVLVPEKKPGFQISDNVQVYSSPGNNKVSKIFGIYKIAKQLMQKNLYDIISTKDTYYLGLASVFLKKKFSTKLEIQVHGFEKLNPLRKILAKYVIGSADGVRTVSQRLKRRLIEDFNIEENKITVVPIFIDCSKFKYRTLPNYKDDSEFNFLTISRLVPIKNINLQIRALKNLLQKGLNVKLTIVGDGPTKKVLQKLSSDLEISDKVIFAGWSDNTKSFMEKSDTFILTSYYEGYGIAPIEAACSGLPVIMTDVGCAGEVIINNENGIIIPPEDVTALINAMQKITENKSLRKKFNENNKRLSEQMPNLEQNLKLYQQSWKKTLELK